ncbi:MAG: tripartite tricarboxylate transporter substrate binding protein, partial [Betaproteobacteria bacterium]|nr:tripartite tricarboxylate transporter substrate binding protein [Betaproteobacteria bacterium]
VQRLFEASQAVLRDPELVNRIVASGNDVSPSKTSAEFATWALEDGVRQTKLALEAGAASGQ